MKELIIKVDDPGKRVWDGSPKTFETQELIRCKDCKWFEMSRYGERGFCKNVELIRRTTFYCADGEKDNNNEGGRTMKFRKKPVVIEAYQTDKPLDIETLEGTMHADPGDWIITGVNGEQYPCKPDIFAKTYDPAEE